MQIRDAWKVNRDGNRYAERFIAQGLNWLKMDSKVIKDRIKIKFVEKFLEILFLFN